VPLVYAELRRVAHRHMRGERPDHLLQATAPVHEAWLRLVDVNRVRWQNRAHFFAVSAPMMRRILVNAARGRDAQKRGGAISRVAFDEAGVAAPGRAVDVVALDDALTAFAEIDPRKAKVVELRFFGGLGVEETAHVL
jgi:RNA polymerase sigma-70 factor (ECF subfamily)